MLLVKISDVVKTFISRLRQCQRQQAQARGKIARVMQLDQQLRQHHSCTEISKAELTAIPAVRVKSSVISAGNGTVCYTSTSLVCSKPYHYFFFFRKHHTGMSQGPIMVTVHALFSENLSQEYNFQNLSAGLQLYLLEAHSVSSDSLAVTVCGRPPWWEGTRNRGRGRKGEGEKKKDGKWTREKQKVTRIRTSTSFSHFQQSAVH